MEEVDIYHMEDVNADAEHIDTVSVAGTGTVQFQAESFSVYVIIVEDNGNTKYQRFYVVEKNQPITVTYLTSSSKEPAITNHDPDVLILSDLTYVGRSGSYYKWTIKVELTDQAVLGKTYSFSLKPVDKNATDFEITFTNTSWELEDFEHEGLLHVDIHKDNASIDITTIVKDGDRVLSQNVETDIPARVTAVNSITINEYNGQIYSGSDGDDEFRFSFGYNTRIAIFKNSKPREITVNVNLETEDGRVFPNVDVTFTPDDLLAAILNCDQFVKNNNGWAVGADFYIRNAQVEIIEQGTGGAEMMNVTVKKTWANDNENVRPNSLSVQLYDDGVRLGGPVNLTASNGWEYTWIVPNDGSVYTVSETVPQDYIQTGNNSVDMPLSITGTIAYVNPQASPGTDNEHAGNFVVIKKGNITYVWTPVELTSASERPTKMLLTPKTKQLN